MNARRFMLPLYAFLALVIAGCDGGAKLRVRAGKEYVYDCTDGTTLRATFYGLSDDSLNFVKVVTADGTEYTLPQLVSASGARYSDEHGMEFWTKGDEVTIRTFSPTGDREVLTRGKIRPQP